MEAKTLGLTGFNVPISDDDSTVLLSNTNKLLSAVGISAKKIISTEELSRVASSLFVAVFESLFHTKIEGVVRSPQSKSDYVHNAQLVIDNLSQQIQLDLKHITGNSIVSGDVRVLSDLVHILVRIVSLTSQESLTSYDSSEFLRGPGERPFVAGHERPLHDNDSISTRQSMRSGAQLSPNHFSHGNDPFNFLVPGEVMKPPHDLLFNEDLKQSIAKAEKYIEFEKKLDSARRRRESLRALQESRARATNIRHAEISREALQRKWRADAEKTRKSFELRKRSEDQVLLRKVYQGLLKSVIKWRIEGQREEKLRKEGIKEQTNWHIESMQHLFEERLKVFAQDDTAVLSGVKSKEARSEFAVADELVRSIAIRNSALLKKERSNLNQKRDRELLRRREAHKNLLTMLAVDHWEDTLRDSYFE